MRSDGLEAVRDAIRDALREIEREWTEIFLLTVGLHAQDLAATQAGCAATLDGLTDSEAAARREARTATRSLDRVMDALVVFEARAKRDPAGAARALCRWLDRVRGSAEKGKAA